jgi:hypothetical protein
MTDELLGYGCPVRLARNPSATARRNGNLSGTAVRSPRDDPPAAGGSDRPARRAILRWTRIVVAVWIVSEGTVISLSVSSYGASPANAPHIMVVMMENKNLPEVIGQSDQPYTNSLAESYGLATRSYSFGHPSLPNYLDIVSGSNQGVTDDDPPSSHSFSNVQTLADQLAAAGISEKAYAENLPADPTTDSGEYAVRHFPWEYFPNTKMPVADASSLIPNLNEAAPPSFVWYTPNLIDDEHDGTVEQGDAFLAKFIPQVQATDWYKAGGQIIITWDESDTDNTDINGGQNGGGHIPTIVVSIEDAYGLPYLGDAADAANGTIDSLLSGTGQQAGSGYWLVGSDGGIFTFGSARFYGSTGSLALQRPVVGMTPTATRGGYWLVASDGGIFSFGNAGFYGSIPGIGLAPAGSSSPRKLNAPIVGMVPSADGKGYFMVAADGGVFAFGDAKFEGSCPGIGGCAGAAVAVMPDASGNGYWLVTATGDVYTFGDAAYYGAPGDFGSPVTSAVRTPDGLGYWILYADGAVFAYGDAAAFSSPISDQPPTSTPYTAIFTTSDGQGYWVAGANGAVYNYGDAPNDGGMAGQHLNGSIIAATGW